MKRESCIDLSIHLLNQGEVLEHGEDILLGKQDRKREDKRAEYSQKIISIRKYR